MQTHSTPGATSKTEPVLAIPNGEMRAETVLGLPISQDQWNTVVVITPERAAKLLLCKSTAFDNRPVRPSRVREFRYLIEKKRLRCTHQGMSFSTRGQLIDGQHRLSACVETGVAIKIQCFFNQDEKDFEAYDRGAIRTVADDLYVMKMAGSGEASVLQAASKILFNLDEDRLPWVTTPKLATQDVSTTCYNHPRLREICSNIYHSRGSPQLPPASTAAFFTLFYEVDGGLATQFLDQMRTGVGLEERDPAMILRRGLSRQRGRASDAVRSQFMIRLVHGWNAFRAGRKVSSLVSALIDGKFPSISGAKKRSKREGGEE